MVKPVLTYFFEAHYFDGRIYKQNKDDASIKYPPVRDDKGHLQGKSCMADIQEDIDNYLIKNFILTGRGNRVAVDLSTGLFEVNGLSVLLESQKLPALPDNFKLIYYRQTTINQNVTFDKGTGDVLSKEDSGHFIEYFLGWECEINNKRYVQKIAVA